MIKFLSSWTAVALVIILFVGVIIWEGFSPKKADPDWVFVPNEKSELPGLEATKIHEFGPRTSSPQPGTGE